MTKLNGFWTACTSTRNGQRKVKEVRTGSNISYKLNIIVLHVTVICDVAQKQRKSLHLLKLLIPGRGAYFNIVGKASLVTFYAKQIFAVSFHLSAVETLTKGFVFSFVQFSFPWYKSATCYNFKTMLFFAMHLNI